MASTEQEHKFVQALGLLDCTTMVAGSMIGSGIFIVSADIARLVGSPGWLILIWMLAGLLTMIAALCYGELAAMMPRAGGQYVYLREAFSPLSGFLYGWTLFLVIQTGEIAAVAVAFARFLGVLAPGWIDENQFLVNFGTVGRFSLSLSSAQVAAIAVIGVLTAVNIGGVRAGTRVQNIFTVAKTGALLAVIALGIFFGRNARAAIHHADFWQPRSMDGSMLTGVALLTTVGIAMVGPLFSHDAWNNITFTASEVRNPGRNIPLALALGTALVTTLYVLTNVSYTSVLPLAAIQTAPSDRVATAAMQLIFGEKASAIMAVAVMISTFGAVNGMILAGARVYYAMAQDGLFFKAVGSLNGRGVPAKGLILQAVWASALVLPRTYDSSSNRYSNIYSSLLNYVVLAVMLFYALTVLGILVLRWKRPEANRPYRAFGYPALPIAYIVAAIAISLVLLTSETTRDQAIPGLFIVLTGLPAYWIWRRRATPR